MRISLTVGMRVWTEHGIGRITGISTNGHHDSVDVALDETGDHYAKWICLPVKAVTPLPAGDLPKYPSA